jgi:parvulin-like peptidyl-prolyl isomerase
MRRIFLISLAVFSLVACQKRQAVIATVGPLSITQKDFQKALNEVDPGYQNYVMTPDGRKQFLDILIRDKLELAAAQASKVPQSPEYLREASKIKKEEKLRLHEALKYLLIQDWEKNLRDTRITAISENEAKSYWKRHPYEVVFSQILVSSPKEAETLLKRIRRGSNFARLARKYSLDSGSAVKGGKMPSALYGEIIPELQDLIFQMRVGELSGPIKTKFGYHVIRKDSQRKVAFEKYKERFIQILEKQKLDNYLQSLQKKFPVEILDEQFK